MMMTKTQWLKMKIITEINTNDRIVMIIMTMNYDCFAKNKCFFGNELLFFWGGGGN